MDPSSSSSTSPTPLDSSSPDRQQPFEPIQPLKNPRFRHVSRSAAKRESVQLLGSIKDLQLHFSRVGVSHRDGVGAGIRLGSLGEGDEEEENRPPSASSTGSFRSGQNVLSKNATAKKERRPWKEVELPRIDPEVAKVEIQDILVRVRTTWGLGGITPQTPTGMSSSPTTPFLPIQDSKQLLTTTAQSIRRIRTLALSLTHMNRNRNVSGQGLKINTLPRPKPRASISTPSRPAGPILRTTSGGSYSYSESTSSRKVSGDSIITEKIRPEEDHLSELRKSALEVLAGLRALEEKLRINVSASQSRVLTRNEAHQNLGGQNQGGGGGDDHHRPTSSLAGASTTGSEDPENQLSDDEEYNLNALAAAEGEMNRHLETWEERIVSEGREYRELHPEEEEGIKEREHVRKWCRIVEAYWVEDKSGVVEEIPQWARSDWEVNNMERLHAFLLAHLPLPMQVYLPARASNESFIEKLSDGFVLSHALNAAVADSRKPWGFIPPEEIHDTMTGGAGAMTPEKDEKSREWTFRRAGNLTGWAAALRHRYNIPISLPNTPILLPVPNLPTTSGPSQPQHTSSRRTSSEILPPMIRPLPVGPAAIAPSWKKDVMEKVEFDPMIVAKRAEGWESMLRVVLEKWIEAVVEEARGTMGGKDGKEEGG